MNPGFSIQLPVIVCLILPGLSASTSRADISLKGLLAEMTDYDSVARWPDPAFTVRQASSYDRARIAPDKPGWFANNDGSGFIRSEQHAGREEHVLLDTDGPGAIVRFFLTTSGSRSGKIRVYLDGADEPAMEWPTLDLMSGEMKIGDPLVRRHPAPLGHGGATLYLPIPYARHCKVTLDEANPKDHGNRYYHIDYRTYPTGTMVETFAKNQLDFNRADIERVNQLLAKPPAEASIYSGPPTVLKTGETKSVDLAPGPMAVRQLDLSIGINLPPAAKEQALRSVILHIQFDNERESVWCPVGDFIGSGAGGRAISGWYRTVDAEANSVSRWVMPYRKTAKVTLENLGSLPVDVQLSAKTTAWVWDDRSMYFHCNWHQQVNIPVRPFRDWNFITTTGRGVLVGDVLSVFNPEAAWYGEGNEKIWVDSESFPSHVGTGTEDYYNASWAPNPVYDGPFANHPRMDEAHGQGQNVYTRSRSLDAIPFTKSLQFDFEIETWKENYAVDYAATTYWYGLPGATCNRGPEPEEARRPVPMLPAKMTIQGAAECESLHVAHRSAGVVTEHQDMRPFPGRWSGDAQLLIRAKKDGDFVELDLPTSSDKPQRITLYATQANDYGTLQFSINGVTVKETFDGYAVNPLTAVPIALGVFAPVDGKLVLRVQLVGTNPKTIGDKYLAGLDAVVVSEK